MRVLKFILETSRPYRLYMWLFFLAIFIIALDANIRPYLIKLLINAAAGANSYSIWTLVIAYAFVQIFSICVWEFSQWCNLKYTFHFRSDIASSLMHKISHYSYSVFQDNLAGSLSAKISNVFNLAPGIIYTIGYQFFQFSLTTFITLFLLAQIHEMFAIGLLVSIVAFFLSLSYGIKRTASLVKEYAEAKSNIWGHLSDTLTNILNVKLFNSFGSEMNRLTHASQDYIEKAQNSGYFSIKFYLTQGMIISVYVIGFLFLLVHLHTNHLISPGDFALVFMLNFKMFDKLFEISYQLRDFINSWGTVDQTLSFFDTTIEIQDAPNATKLRITKGEITFYNVGFHYKGAKPLFTNKSITIAPGQKVGLVGYSGGGKTTFCNLILRLYDVTDGRILIDEQDIRDVTQDSLRKNIGMIPQDPSLFHRTLMENIRYGKADATDAEVIDAAKRAHAHEFIEKLPNGYNSLVGERGVKLSGGQRQRVAIARAILKNAPILILDEATSQLDSVTERDIQDSLWNLMQNKTTIIIAHRLSTLLHMDRILVFDAGQIIEDGTHEELLTQGGMYKMLWDAQVGGFLPEAKYDPDGDLSICAD